MDYWEARAKKRADLKVRLEEKYGVVGHPKADLLFDMAWDYGHSGGEEGVEFYYEDLIELIK